MGSLSEAGDSVTSDLPGDVLPLDFLRVLFSTLSSKDVCSAACTCRSWQLISAEQWPDRVRCRWSRGGSRWLPLEQQNKHLQIYAERHQLDEEALLALSDMPWPMLRGKAVANLLLLDSCCLDLLSQSVACPIGKAGSQAEAACNTPGAGGSQVEAAQAVSEDGEQWMGLGRKYWSWQALTQLQVARCALEIRSLMAGPQSEDLDSMERLALLIAQVHYPNSNMDDVVRHLDQLGAELRLRLEDGKATRGGRKALEILNDLLYGEPPPVAASSSKAPPNGSGARHGSSVSGDEAEACGSSSSVAAGFRQGQPAAGPLGPPSQHSGAAAAAGLGHCQLGPLKWRCTLEDAEGGARRTVNRGSGLMAVPPPSFGLGLMGNREDYQNPRNSLLPDVLSLRTGIPISLAVVHMAVGRRAGLPLELLNMPMHVISRLRKGMLPRPWGPARAHGGSSREELGGVAEGGGDAEPAVAVAKEEREGEEGEEELYIDVYGGGKIMDRAQLHAFMRENLGLPTSRHVIERMNPPAACQRMCANLAGIYSSRQDSEQLWAVLELLTAANPRARDYIGHKYRAELTLRDFDGAARTLQQMRRVLVSEATVERRPYVEDQMTKLLTRMSEQQVEFSESCRRVILRPEAVRFGIGTVVRHLQYRYRGVIFDWDPTCSVEEHWVMRMGVDALQGGRQQPFYRLLVDVRDRPFQNTYVAQCNLQLMSSPPTADSTTGRPWWHPSHPDQAGQLGIANPEIGRYFDGLEAGRYVPNDYMRSRFPDG